MARVKKISFRYSLYRKGKYAKKQDEYPVYIKVIFNGKSTEFPCSILETIPLILEHYLSEKDFKKIDDNEYYRNLEKYIEMIVRFEYSQQGDSYRIKGIGNRLYKYFIPLEALFEFHYDMIIMDRLGDVLTHNSFVDLITKWKMTYALSKSPSVYVPFEMPELIKKLIWVYNELNEAQQGVLIASGALIQPFFLYVLFDRQSDSEVFVGSNNYFVIDWISNTIVKKNIATFLESFDFEEKVENIDFEKDLFIESYKLFFYDSTYDDPISLINELENALTITLPTYLESIE